MWMWTVTKLRGCRLAVQKLKGVLSMEQHGLLEMEIKTEEIESANQENRLLLTSYTGFSQTHLNWCSRCMLGIGLIQCGLSGLGQSAKLLAGLHSFKFLVPDNVHMAHHEDSSLCKNQTVHSYCLVILLHRSFGCNVQRLNNVDTKDHGHVGWESNPKATACTLARVVEKADDLLIRTSSHRKRGRG